MKQQANVFVMIQFVLFAMLAAALLLLPAGQVLWARLMGLLLVALGGVLGLLAILTHMQVNRNMVNVSPEPNAQNQLVRTGIYAYIRHPIYSGVMLVALGIALAHGHFVPLGVAVGLCAFFAYKSTFEEQWLMQVYPEYEEYRRHTGRFVPRLLRG